MKYKILGKAFSAFCWQQWYWKYLELKLELFAGEVETDIVVLQQLLYIL